MLKTSPLIRNISFRYFILLFFLITSSFSKEGLNHDILKYTNQFRRSKGLSVLIMRDDLNTIARRHSEDMAKGRSGFGHTGYDQREQQVQKLIKPFHAMAENVAYGAGSGKQVVDLWKNSSGHRRNMLGNYKYIGIGTACNKQGIIFYTQIFVR